LSLKSKLDLLKIYISATFGGILVTLTYMAQNLIGDKPIFKSLSFFIFLAFSLYYSYV